MTEISLIHAVIWHDGIWVIRSGILEVRLRARIQSLPKRPIQIPQNAPYFIISIHISSYIHPMHFIAVKMTHKSPQNPP